MTVSNRLESEVLEPDHLSVLVRPQHPRQRVLRDPRVPLEDPALDVMRKQHRRSLELFGRQDCRVRKVEDRNRWAAGEAIFYDAPARVRPVTRHSHRNSGRHRCEPAHPMCQRLALVRPEFKLIADSLNFRSKSRRGSRGGRRDQPDVKTPCLRGPSGSGSFVSCRPSRPETRKRGEMNRVPVSTTTPLQLGAVRRSVTGLHDRSMWTHL